MFADEPQQINDVHVQFKVVFCCFCCIPHVCRNNLGASLLLLIFHPGVEALIFICQLNEIMFAKFKCLYTIDMKTVYMCP